MNRAQLEHVLRAAGAIADVDVLVVIGSQSVLGTLANPPHTLTVSMEVDLYPPDDPARADDIDGAIGEGSPFHEMHGYYAQGVGPDTAVLPHGWQDRLVELATPATNGVRGLCLDVHDLAIAKLVAGRPKDLAFVAELARHGLVQRGRLVPLADVTPVPERTAKILQGRIAALPWTEAR